MKFFNFVLCFFFFADELFCYSNSRQINKEAVECSFLVTEVSFPQTEIAECAGVFCFEVHVRTWKLTSKFCLRREVSRQKSVGKKETSS